MAYNTGNKALDDLLNFIANTWDITVADTRVQRWLQELASGTRSMSDLRRDILHYVVGDTNIQNWINEQFGGQISGSDTETAEERMARLVNELKTGTRTFSQLATDIQAATGGGGGVPTDTSPSPPPAGESGDFPGILRGGKIIRVERPNADDLYYMAYEYPPGSGQWFTFQFENVEQLEQTFGPEWWKAVPLETKTQAWFDKYAIEAGDATEVIGQSGNWNNFITDIIKEGLEAAGITDPTIYGQMLNDPEMQNLFAKAWAEGWTEEQILAEQRKTEFWTEVLYPGIENLYGRTDDPERAWSAYVGSVHSALVSLGYEKDADGTFKSKIEEMLDAGIEAETFMKMVPTFLRAQNSPEFANQLAKWTKATLGKDMDFEDWFDLMEGEADPDLMMVAERATLAYLADTSGTIITDKNIIRLSNETDLTEAQAAAAFAEYDAALTALAGRGLSRYGLTQDDIFSLKTGLAPLSGKGHEAIRVKAIQAAREEGLLDDDKIDLFIGYDQTRGAPVRPGLNLLAPERG